MNGRYVRCFKKAGGSVEGLEVDIRLFTVSQISLRSSGDCLVGDGDAFLGRRGEYLLVTMYKSSLYFFLGTVFNCALIVK